MMSTRAGGREKDGKAKQSRARQSKAPREHFSNGKAKGSPNIGLDTVSTMGILYFIVLDWKCSTSSLLCRESRKDCLSVYNHLFGLVEIVIAIVGKYGND